MATIARSIASFALPYMRAFKRSRATKCAVSRPQHSPRKKFLANPTSKRQVLMRPAINKRQDVTSTRAQISTTEYSPDDGTESAKRDHFSAIPTEPTHVLIRRKNKTNKYFAQTRFNTLPSKVAARSKSRVPSILK